MAQGALGAAGVGRVGHGLEVGRSVRTASGTGSYCVATRTACSVVTCITQYKRHGGAHSTVDQVSWYMRTQCSWLHQ